VKQAAHERLRHGYLVERYQPAVTINDALSGTDRVAAAAARRARDHGDLTYLGTVLLPDDEALLDLFAATSEAPVREVCHLARTRAARITKAVLITPSPSANPALIRTSRP